MIPPAGSLLLDDELLDHPDADPAAVAISLHNIGIANRWFGGWWAVRRGLKHVTRRLDGSAARLTLLDIGCGRGDLSVEAAAWAAARGISVLPLGLDRHRTAAQLSQHAGVTSLLGCVSALPVRAKSVDIVLASQLVHHLTPDQMIEFCRAADRVARLGVVIADLRRSPWALAAFWVGSRLFRFDPATRHDGITSVRRGFTNGELTELLRRAGIAAHVERSPGFRLVASWLTSERR